MGFTSPGRPTVGSLVSRAVVALALVGLGGLTAGKLAPLGGSNLWAQDEGGSAGQGDKTKSKDSTKKKGGKDEGKPPGEKKSPQPPKEKDGEEDEAEADSAEPKDGEDAEAGSGEGSKPTTVKRSIEEEYVRENLAAFLSANSVEFLDNGNAKILLELNEKKEEWAKCFEPNVSSEGAKAFRWSRADEDDYFRGYVPGPDGTTDQYSKGLRLGNTGMANLNCWFVDDIDVEMVYVQGTGYNKDQVSALVFTNAKGKSIGANFASQCLTFQKTARGPAKGQVEPLPAWTVIRSKLSLHGGNATVYKNSKRRSEMAYKPKEFETGRVGFIWAGNMASFVYRLEITGKLDYKKMAELMKKRKG